MGQDFLDIHYVEYIFLGSCILKYFFFIVILVEPKELDGGGHQFFTGFIPVYYYIQLVLTNFLCDLLDSDIFDFRQNNWSV